MTRLGANERILWEGTRAWTDFPGRWIGGGVVLLMGASLLFLPESWARGLGLVVMLLSLLFPATIWLERISRHYTVTSERAITRYGLIARKIAEIELKHVQDIELQQGFLQRLLRVGTLALSTAAGPEAEIVFEGIADPEGVKELIRGGVR